ncbi:MAG: hypothetical protein E6G49_06370 [Actinobacteria bacterium]|nr:MAG: hypothetical protein E6G49_06370 [Actinomycetota bacterium]
MRSAPRFPSVSRDAGHYESYYLKATRPGGGRGVWIRHTVHKRPEEDATAALWLTLFDADAPGPRAVKAAFGADELSVPDGGYIRIDGAALEPGHAKGKIATPELSAGWDLRFSDDGDAFHHLPYDRLYDAPLPRTKFLSPYPSARFDGGVTVGEEVIEVSSWPGMVGHNWGAEHAERWVWIQGAFLDGEEPTYFDMAAGRIKLGPVQTPWVGNAMLRIGSVEHRLGGFDRMLSTKVSERPTSCTFQIAGKGIKVRGRVASEARNFVAWVYADPKGPEHNTINCSISDLELEVQRDGRPPERLEVIGAAAYEFGTRDTDHGIPLQPYSDG